MKINNISDYIKKSLISAEKNIDNEFRQFVEDLEVKLKESSPVDQGEFKQSWTSTTSSQSGNLTSIISNSHVAAGAIEFGSLPGSRPWPNPGPKTSLSGGRIYSSQAIGGVINKVVDDAKITEFANRIADSIMRVFK